MNFSVYIFFNLIIDFSRCGLGLENIATVNQDINQNEEKKTEPWPWMAALFFLLPGSGRRYQVLELFYFIRTFILYIIINICFIYIFVLFSVTKYLEK